MRTIIGYKGQQPKEKREESTKEVLQQIQEQKKQLEKLEATRKEVEERIKVLQDIKTEYIQDMAKRGRTQIE